MTGAGERIALVVVTRDRAALLERLLLPSLREVAAAGHEVVVVDQSRDDGTERLVGGLDGVRYVRSGPGLSRGRNAAAAATDVALLAFTDDDVTLPERWLEHLQDTFRRHGDAGAVCGRGLTPEGVLLPGAPAGTYRWPAHPFRLGSGFSLALRRAALEQAGPFDEELGAGARYGAGEDTDMLYRLLRAGWSVVCTDELPVVHHDWRSAREEAALHYRYGLGAGAQTAGHLRAGDRRAGRVALAEAGHHLHWLARSLARGRMRVAWLQLVFLGGLAAGLARRLARGRAR